MAQLSLFSGDFRLTAAFEDKYNENGKVLPISMSK